MKKQRTEEEQKLIMDELQKDLDHMKNAGLIEIDRVKGDEIIYKITKDSYNALYDQTGKLN
jgi:hypothetical protein